MIAAKRVSINTLAQFSKTIISIILGLYSTRIILNGLGNSDFGIYTLLAGVVGMLSFIINALSLTTQRFLSYNRYLDQFSLRKLFNNSLWIHLILATLLLICLEISSRFIITDLINIPADRVNAAYIVLQCTILMVVLSLLCSPYRALLTSHENLVFASFIDVIDASLKVIIAFVILDSNVDRLILYSILMGLIQLFNLLAFTIFCRLKYNESKLLSIKHLNITLVKSITKFAGWSIYSTFCIIGRNQGVAIVLNTFLGTIINAAYGVATQINNAANYLSSSLLNAISPPLISAEGAGKRDLVNSLASSSSKFCFILLSIVIVPLLFFIDNILSLWLTEVPENSALLCRVILITSLVDSLSTGFSVANKAIGKLRKYSLLVDSQKLLVLPTLYVFLYLKIPLQYCIWIYAILEAISAIIRVGVMHNLGCISIADWWKIVVKPLCLPTTILIITYYIFSLFKLNIICIIACIIIISILYAIATTKYATNAFEKSQLEKIISKVPILKTLW